MSNPPPYPEPSQPPLAYETPQAQWNAVTIGAIALKLMGIYCFIQVVPAVTLLSYLTAVPTRQGYLLQVVGSIAAYAIYLIMGIAFIFFAAPISQRLFRGETTHAAILE